MFVDSKIIVEDEVGLNPFEFRADVCHMETMADGTRDVLIPLNSGLMFVGAGPADARASVS